MIIPQYKRLEIEGKHFAAGDMMSSCLNIITRINRSRKL
jgi:hypothetical protein